MPTDYFSSSSWSALKCRNHSSSTSVKCVVFLFFLITECNQRMLSACSISVLQIPRPSAYRLRRARMTYSLPRPSKPTMGFLRRSFTSFGLPARIWLVMSTPLPRHFLTRIPTDSTGMIRNLYARHPLIPSPIRCQTVSTQVTTAHLKAH